MFLKTYSWVLKKMSNENYEKNVMNEIIKNLVMVPGTVTLKQAYKNWTQCAHKNKQGKDTPPQKNSNLFSFHEWSVIFL